LTRNLYI